MPADTNLKLPTRRYSIGFGVAWEAHKYFKWWFAVIIVLAMVTPPAVFQFSSTEIEVSAWEFAAYSGKIFSAIVAGTFLYTMFPNALAQGLTRREFATSMGLFGPVWSLILGALALAGFILEHLWYGLFDWNQAIQRGDRDLALDSLGAVLTHGVTYPLSYLLFFAGGALIGAACYRWDSGWLILVPVAPVVFSLDFALTRADPWGPGWFRWLTGLSGDASSPVAAAAMVVVIAVFAWLGRAILLETPVRAKKA